MVMESEGGEGLKPPSQPRRRERDRGGQANDGEATYVDVEEGRYYMRMERREIGTGEGYLACFLWVEDVRGMANNSKHSTKVGGARIFGSWMCGPRWPNHVNFFSRLEKLTSVWLKGIKATVDLGGALAYLVPGSQEITIRTPSFEMYVL